MNHFFKVKTLEQVIGLVPEFSDVGVEKVHLSDAFFRVLAADIESDQDIPGFRRATMDGYAVHCSSTFGASESNPAWLRVVGDIGMGDVPQFAIQSGEAARISTGGMLPKGADSVVMVEHTESVDCKTTNDIEPENSRTVEIYKSVAPLQNVIDSNEDFKKGEKILKAGSILRVQEIGLFSALGLCELAVYKIPKVGIISTGDEIVPIEETPPKGKIRDINSYTLSGLIVEAGAKPIRYGIIKDDESALFDLCEQALYETDMVLISGGSSVGTRDFTVKVLSSLKNTQLLAHGISISPGKPTILAKSKVMQANLSECRFKSNFYANGESRLKPIWGLPGHAVSAMIVFKVIVLPFLRQLQGLTNNIRESIKIPAILTRNVASAQGRTDFIRVKLISNLDYISKNNISKEIILKNLQDKKTLFAEPILGKSGLIRTMVMADGLLEIGENEEGIEKGEMVNIIPMF